MFNCASSTDTCLCLICQNNNGKKCRITKLTKIKNTCKNCEKGSHAVEECEYFMQNGDD